MRWRDRIAALLRSSVGRERPIWRTLRDRGASRELVRFAREHDGARELWARCPRPSWAIEIAARAGVDGGRIERAVEEMVDAERAAAAEELASAITEGRLAAQAYTRGELPPEALVDATAALASALVESREDVRAALRERLRWRRGEASIAAVDACDAMYANALRELTASIRRSIRAEEIRIALEGRQAHPYR